MISAVRPFGSTNRLHCARTGRVRDRRTSIGGKDRRALSRHGIGVVEYFERHGSPADLREAKIFRSLAAGLCQPAAGEPSRLDSSGHARLPEEHNLPEGTDRRRRDAADDG